MMRKIIKPSLRGQTGSFVIEALVSVLLFSVGIVALMMVMTQSTNQVGQSKARNDASYLAGELIGELWVTVTPAGITPQVTVANALDTSFTGNVITAWKQRALSILPAGAPDPLIVPNGTQVAITIYWPDPKDPGVTHQYSTTADIVK